MISGNQLRSRRAPPRAPAMLEALRGLGYTAPTALADIIDNSISAGARRIDLRFDWNGVRSTVSLLDDGHGMTGDELERAMRLGDRNPLEARAVGDLGRFGLGLKTASFSQCRRLTVASLGSGEWSCLRWDLDFMAASKDADWHLLEGPEPGSEPLLEPLRAQSQGTIVVWEVLDRIVTPGFREQDYLDLIDAVEQHLGLVFHRYLAGPSPRLRIDINGQLVGARDPFLLRHGATWSSPRSTIGAGNQSVGVQCHVLPHRDRLSKEEYESAAGPDGWSAHQGFYVYRNERLLLAGSWLGLGRGRAWTKEEAHRLARIRLDIQNSADSEWKIDIRKSTARPPVAIRAELTRLAEDTRSRARRVFAHRGTPTRSGSTAQVAQAWRAEHFSGGMRYRIDTTHPAVSSVLESAGVLVPALKAMLRVIEETVPVQRIWLDTTESHETPRTGFAGEPPAVVRSVLVVLYRNLVLSRGVLPERAREILKNTDPFHNYAALVDALPDVLEGDT